MFNVRYSTRKSNFLLVTIVGRAFVCRTNKFCRGQSALLKSLAQVGGPSRAKTQQSFMRALWECALTSSFPFHRRRWFICDVVDNTIDFFYFICEACRDPFQNFVWKLGE